MDLECTRVKKRANWYEDKPESHSRCALCVGAACHCVIACVCFAKWTHTHTPQNTPKHTPQRRTQSNTHNIDTTNTHSHANYTAQLHKTNIAFGHCNKESRVTRKRPVRPAVAIARRLERVWFVSGFKQDRSPIFRSKRCILVKFPKKYSFSSSGRCCQLHAYAA